jgi:2-polyprenyl-3-methyl-5-hydroxy-6-metoxy-1,4-benzoquinol methylase
VPTTTAAENASFYQSEYEESITTELPDERRLEELREENFASLSTSYLPYIEVLRALGARPGHRVLDFGCSWGYGSHQLRESGFDVQAYEISKPRAAYAAANLGVQTVEIEAIEPGGFDVFFSAHVIEHVPSVEGMLELGERALKPGGLFLAFTPNGSAERRQSDPMGWHRSWGGVHPQLMDAEFLRHNARPERSFLAAACPYPLDDIRRWNGTPTLLDMRGSELMLAFRKPSS